MDYKTRENKMIEMRLQNLMTLREIGEHFNISRERVRQIIGNTGHDYVAERTKAKIENSTEATPDLAERLGLCTATISRYRNNHHDISGGSAMKGEIAEKYVSDKMASLGIENELMPIGHSFDLLVNDKIRVDIKASYKTSATSPNYKSPQWHFCIQTDTRGKYCDYFVCVIWKTKDCFIIPFDEIGVGRKDLWFCYPTKRPNIGKYQKYHERWDLLK
jgi:hypothetical protein